ncbi:MAG: FtsX-like permease family protein [Lachnospiraceae bacterium]|nr:FtsX-like permease family protein [Lachnospiraceae bacterium]
MQKILRKRVLREFRAHALRYFALGFLIVISIYMIVALLGAAETVIRGVEEHAEMNRVEDGEFQTFAPMTAGQLEELASGGAAVEPQFYLDFETEDGGRIRVFRNRIAINLVELEAGSMPGDARSLVLERRFAEVNGIGVGDILPVGGEDFRVCGIGTTPDYDVPVAGMTDSTVDSKQFGTAFVSAEAFRELERAGTSMEAETYIYAYRLNGALTDEEMRDRIEAVPFDEDDVEDPYFREYMDEQLGDVKSLREMLDSPLFEGKDTEDLKKEMDIEIHNLQMFVTKEENMRIGGSASDVVINRAASLLAGVIIVGLFAYVIAVFVIHGIEEDSMVIGALYSMGVRGGELLRHYIILPVAVAGISGIIGTLIGYTPAGVNFQMQDTYSYYSVPSLAVQPIGYIFAYGIILPPVIAALVNAAVIRRRLRRTPLSLLRNERRESGAMRLAAADASGMRRHRARGEKGCGEKGRGDGRCAASGRKAFIRRFRVKQMIRESRAALTVLAGLLICLVLAFIGIDCWVMCGHIQRDNIADTKFAYMYLYKYPEKEVPEGGEAAFARSFKKEHLGYRLDVMLLGLQKDSRYFDADPAPSQKEVVISSAMAQKYGLKRGDEVTLDDDENGRYYAFRVKDIYQYSPGFYVFMDIDSMRDLLGEKEDYYNCVFSDRELPIEKGRLYSTLSKEGIRKAADVFINLMWSMIYFMLGLTGFIFIAVMYLMLGVMIDHSSYDIALMKIFGFRDREVRQLYVSGNFYLIAAGSAVIIPLSKKIIDSLYPMLVSNVACAMDLSMNPLIYLLIYAVILVMYLLISTLLRGRIRKVSPAEVLKNRE